MNKTIAYTIVLLVLIGMMSQPAEGQVKHASKNGFMVKLERKLKVDSKLAYRKFVEDFSSWYDASHSYSQKAENLSLDLDKHCMFERLPDGGFVRHMEIVFHQPGKMLRLTGGLGPLQGMGVAGAMTFAFENADDGCQLTMTYYVSGADHLNLDKIAEPVSQVLIQQLDRFQKYCGDSD